MMLGNRALPRDFYSQMIILKTMVVSAAYLLLSIFLVGFKIDQLVLLLIFNGFFYFSARTRKFVIGFSIFIIYWIIFDYMKAFPNYRYEKVSIAELYCLEKDLFGINLDGKIFTLNEFWQTKHVPTLDVLTGLFYLMWVPVPLFFAGYLYFKDKLQFIQFSLAFLWVNLIGFFIYYLYPAAPPWYVQIHGFKFLPQIPGNTAGLSRFDNFFGIELFKNLYSKGSNVFAAMPSLHSAYPVVVLYYGMKNRLGRINIFFLLVMLGIWFSAVYNSHHYVLDVIAGALCAALALITFTIALKTKSFHRFIEYLLVQIRS